MSPPLVDLERPPDKESPLSIRLTQYYHESEGNLPSEPPPHSAFPFPLLIPSSHCPFLDVPGAGRLGLCVVPGAEVKRGTVCTYLLGTALKHHVLLALV